MSILSAEYAAAMLKAGTPEQVDFAPIGTGPFSLLAYQKDAVIRFKAVPDHWTKAVGNRDRMALVNDLIFVITPDAAVRFAKVRSGECQIARYPNPGDLPAMKTEAEHQPAAGQHRRSELPRLQPAEEALRRQARARGAGLCHQHPGDHRRGLSGHRQAHGRSRAALAVVA